MPVVVDPDPDAVDLLLEAMAPGSHAVESVERLQAWLHAHLDEYVVVLGPTLDRRGVGRGLRGRCAPPGRRSA